MMARCGSVAVLQPPVWTLMWSFLLLLVSPGSSCSPEVQLSAQPGSLTVLLRADHPRILEYGAFMKYLVYLAREGEPLEEYGQSPSSLVIKELEEGGRYCVRVGLVYHGVRIGLPSCVKCQDIPQSGERARQLLVTLVLVISVTAVLVVLSVIYFLLFQSRRIKEWMRPPYVEPNVRAVVIHRYTLSHAATNQTITHRHKPNHHTRPQTKPSHTDTNQTITQTQTKPSHRHKPNHHTDTNQTITHKNKPNYHTDKNQTITDTNQTITRRQKPNHHTNTNQTITQTQTKPSQRHKPNHHKDTNQTITDKPNHQTQTKLSHRHEPNYHTDTNQTITHKPNYHTDANQTITHRHKPNYHTQTKPSHRHKPNHHRHKPNHHTRTQTKPSHRHKSHHSSLAYSAISVLPCDFTVVTLAWCPGITVIIIA
uniref:Uncharacterized LOC115529264 n=1 Tax=Gadus morhua TaxID=8049 RepID=A0A8C5CRF1_GADMO